MVASLTSKSTINGVGICKQNGIEFSKQMSDYSSFVGNFLFRHLNLPDMCLAAFEIGRRAYEYKKQFTNKKKV